MTPFKDYLRAVGISVLIILALSLMFWAAHARDLDGRYANSSLHDWFNHLASKKGLCCAEYDGYSVADVDWEVKDGHYRVRIPRSVDAGKPSEEMIWVDVPDDAVIEEPNKAGRTMVWPIYGYLGVSIRCFMPGALT